MGYGAGEPRQGPGVGAGPPRPHRAHGRARQEPPLGHHLVARQRGRRRRQLRGRPTPGSSSAIPRARSSTSGPSCGRHTDIFCPMYACDREHGRSYALDEAGAAPHPVRIRPRHGQLAPATSRTTGTSSRATTSSRAPSSGTGSTRACAKTDETGEYVSGPTAATTARPTSRRDQNFCCNGMVGPDRTPHPALLRSEEGLPVRQVPGRATRTRGRSKSTNRYDFIDLDRFDLDWELSASGKTMASGTVA